MKQTAQFANDIDFIRSILKSQYHGSLAMLCKSVELCPESLWTQTGHKNAFWQIAYHALYFAHLYLQKNEASFRPWKEHKSAPNNDLAPKSEPYSKSQVLTYCDFCDGLVDNAVDVLDLRSADCGFHWYKVSKLEHQLISIRHIQHHSAQLADRLRDAINVNVRWVAAGKARSPRKK
jgi:hypothetical protein